MGNLTSIPGELADFARDDFRRDGRGLRN